jgi:cellobiose transport system permease protein
MNNVANTKKVTSVQPITPASRGSLWREIYKNRTLYLFISPFYLLFLIFGLFPIVFSLYLSFHKWGGLGAMEFVGLKQFTYAIRCISDCLPTQYTTFKI